MGLRRRAWQVLFLAMSVRLLWLGLLLLSTHRRVGSSDSLFYDQVGWNLARGHGYVFEGSATAFHPPGYPLLLAAVYEVAGRSQGAAQVVGILFSCAACVLTVAVALKLGLGERVAVVSGLIMAVYPSQVFYSTFIGSEAVCTALLVGGYLAALHKRYLFASLCIGAAALTRSVALVFVPLLVAWILVERVDLSRVRRVGVALVVVLASCLPLVPWAVRNDRSLGSPIFTTTSDGYSMWAGNSPGAKGNFRSLTAEVGRALPKDEVKKDAKLRRLAIRFMTHHPASVAALVPRKLWYLFVPDISGLSFNRYENPSRLMSALRLPLAVAAELFNAVVICAAVIGFWRLRHANRRATFLLAVPVIAFIASVLATHAENRYRVPFAWLFALPAAVAFDASVRMGHGFSWPRQTQTSGASASPARGDQSK